MTTKINKQKRNEYMKNYYRKKVGDSFGKSKFAIKYTEEETNFILNNYKNMSNLQISRILSKSLLSIKNKIQRLRKEGIELTRTDEELNAHRKKSLEYMKSIGPKKYVLKKPWRKMVTLSDGRRILETHYIWCNQPGNMPYIPKGFVIHHYDGNPVNNSPDNLVMLPQTYHKKFHVLASKRIREEME